MMKSSPAKKDKILILDGLNRNGLAVIRSLGRKRCICDVVSRKQNIVWEKMQTIFRSKFVRKIHFLKNLDIEELLYNELSKLLEKEKYNYIIPVGTYATNFTSKYKEKLSNYAETLIEDYSKVWLVHNKISCMEWAQSIGIPTPKTFVIKNYNDLSIAAKQIDFPVVVKFPDSCASEGLWTFPGGGGKLIEQYLQCLPKDDLASCNESDLPIIQQKIAGPLMDLTAFAVKGESLALLTQERIVTAWLDGGGGFVNKTNDIKEIKEYGKKILSKLRWTGPIEMDWIRDEEDGTYKLLEINPKFWGTTQLTISAGFDFPAWLIDIARGIKLQPPTDYKKELMFRWIIDELITILSKPKDKERLIEEFNKFKNRFTYQPCLTDLCPNDPYPFILDALLLLIKAVYKKDILKGLINIIKYLLVSNQTDGIMYMANAVEKK